MSGIAGNYSFKSDIQQDQLEQMIAAMSHRGPDASGIWTEKNIGLAANLLKTTPESEFEIPVTSGSSDRFKLVWDGRIDNRDELITCLAIPSLQSISDPALFLECWQAWGTDSLKQITGEFAFALWDRTSQRLFAGRDKVGVKPFHYTWQGETFYFSSEIKPLLSLFETVPAFDDNMAVSFLAFRQFREEDHAKTFFQKISKLPPAHFLVIKKGQLTVERYFSWDLNEKSAYKTKADYAAVFKDIFKKAVSARLRSKAPVTVLLSGGHDSSAIVSQAAEIVRSAKDSHAGLESLNYFSDDPQMDERDYARQASEAAGVPLRSFFAKTNDFESGLSQFLHQVELPMVNTSRNTEPLEFLNKLGRQVVLSGEGGDQVLDEFGFGTDLISRFRVFEFLKKSKAFAAEYNDNPADFRRESIRPLLPNFLVRIYRKFTKNLPPSWISKDILTFVDLIEKMDRPETAEKFQSYAQAATFTEVTKPYSVMKLELDEKAYAAHGLEIRYPFLDSRVIQFVLSLPREMRASGTRKAILKEAMKGLVPEALLERKSKANHTSETDRAIDAFAQKAPFRVSGLLARYVSIEKAEKLLERYQSGEKHLRFEIWFMITLDTMLKTFTQGAQNEAKQKQEKEISVSASH